jgi:DNA-binding SARP family transcriptional activator
MVDVTDHMATSQRPRLHESWITALEGRVTADLMLGRHHELVAELTGLVTEHPLRERLRAQLMTALYQQGRAVLAEEYGVDPGPVLKTTYQAMLTGDLRLSGEPTAPVAAHGTRVCSRPRVAARGTR